MKPTAVNPTEAAVLLTITLAPDVLGGYAEEKAKQIADAVTKKKSPRFRGHHLRRRFRGRK